MNILPLGIFLEFPVKNDLKVDYNSTCNYRSVYCDSLPDDFYTNLLEWADNLLYYVKEENIFSYNFLSSLRTLIYTHDDVYNLCSMKYMKRMKSLVIGDTSGAIVVIDTMTLRYTTRKYHEKKISTLYVHDDVILTGSKDKTCKMIDWRGERENIILSHHKEEVCGIAMNRDGSALCSGGNDNKVIVVDSRRMNIPLFRFSDHRAAVRALSWSPLNKTKFISGGGSNDKTIKSWDISQKDPLTKSKYFDSQVCNIKWLKSNKVMSTFGYTNDDIFLLNNLEIEKKFIGHKNRVIHFSVNETEEYFASGSADVDIKIFQIDDRREHEFKMR